MNQEYAILLGEVQPSFLKNESLADIFRQTAAQYPTKVALIFNEKEISYQDLNHWSDAFAVVLIQHGISVGDAIGVWLKRGIELHVAILGIVKAGATYVPLDYEMPKERVETVLLDVNAKACISSNSLEINIPIYDVVPFSNQLLELPDLTIPTTNYAYILYTSGSTGKPKGIPIMQKQICHLVRAENHFIKLYSTDKVYQGFSVSFDMWCEETWISYFVGATIWVADEATAKAIDEVSDVLRKHQITVLHAVPSLLAIMDNDLPKLRIVNSGGEACTSLVLQKWATGQRVFYNSYGPTETTVTSSMIALQSHDKITIGYPLPNYNYAIVDNELNLLPYGELGELVITGYGVGRGYINLPQLSTEKFVANPHDSLILPGPTIYRTGDEAIIHPDGTVEFHGRIDDQIKIRGYRVELGEIENQLASLDGVRTASVCVKKDSQQQPQLVGYVIPELLSEFDEHALRESLQKVLAPYMVPQIIMALGEMPRLPSGKINRKLLPTPPSFESQGVSNADIQIDPEASVQEKVYVLLKHLFPNKEISAEADFFTDLGGHSLLAASFVSALRKVGNMKNISLKDVYLNRPIRKLISTWEETSSANSAKESAYQKISIPRYWICTMAQSISLVFIYGLFACQIFLPYLGYYYIQTETESHSLGLLFSLGLFCVLPPALSMLSILAKWLLIGKYKEGEYPLWGAYYFRWWFVEKLEGLVQVTFLNGTPLYRSYLRIRGLKIGADAQIGTLDISAEDLISIGKNVSISSNVIFNNVVIEDGLIKFTKIDIGDHVYIGSTCVIEGNTQIESWAEIHEMSCLKSGSKIKSGEIWHGSPACFSRTKNAEEHILPEAVSLLKKKYYYVQFMLMLFIFPFAILLPLLPVLVVITELDNNSPSYDFSYFIHVPLLALLYMTLFALQTILLTRILQYKLKPGVYSIYSRTYFRKWLSDQLMSLSLMIMHPVYATVYISTFFRALGAKIGKYTEISTANNVTHPLLEIGENSFIADNVNLGESDVRSQRLILNTTKIGNRSFVGNSALIPQGYSLGDDMLIGVLSIPPTVEQMQENASKDWFGSPAIALPNRQASNSYDQGLTFRPSILRWLSRASIELIRIIIPETVLLCTSILFIAYVHEILIDYTWWQFMFLFPFYFVGFIGLPCFFFVVLLKWIFVGKYKAEQLPMWSLKVWLSEAVTSSYEALAVPFFLDFLKGTCWLPFFMRFLGVKIGKRVYLDTTDITEFDMVHLGKEAALNFDCGPQTHLFEDRVMKVGSIKIGDRASIGAGTIVLYDSEIGNDVVVGPLSLLMKGESLQSSTIWDGSPLRPSKK
jgi:acyl-coenzyme A synthetase/AMP-(fatty) acid ligase